MARYHLIISALGALFIAAGALGIGRAAMIGMDRITWSSLGLMFALAWVAITMVNRMPVTAEAAFRIKEYATWAELSPLRRCFLLWFDWPMFIEVRHRETRRIFDEPLVSVKFDIDSVTIRPLDALHSDPYFLEAIASSAAGHGLEVSNIKQSMFRSREIEPHVDLAWCGSNCSIWQHLRDEVGDRASIPLQIFIDALEAGYVKTLTPEDRQKYLMETR